MVRSKYAPFDHNAAPATGDTRKGITIPSRTNTIITAYAHNVIDFEDPTLKAPLLDM